MLTIINEININGFTLSILREKYHINHCTNQTLKNNLAAHNIHCYRAKRKPKLTADQKAERVLYAYAMHDWPEEKHNRIAYSDENSFYNIKNSPTFWGIMQVRLDAMQLTHGEPRDCGELEMRVKQVYNAISLETILKLYQSVPKRLEEVITNTDGPTDD